MPGSKPSSFQLRLGEVSALSIRHDTAHGEELLAVGDEQYAVVTAPLDGDLEAGQERHDLGDVVARRLRGRKSQWEAIATDGKGRVFVIREDTAAVAVFSRRLRKHVHTIELLADRGPDRRAAALVAGDNKGAEGMLLLRRGHVLVVKQRKPVLLVEFGPRAHSPIGFGKAAHLPGGKAFKLSAGRRSALVPLQSWKLRARDERLVESANDLAVDDRGRLHAISSLSRCIYELAGAANGKVNAGRPRPLPSDIDASPDRKAEGLAFDAAGHPIVAVDTREGYNVFRLTRLPR